MRTPILHMVMTNVLLLALLLPVSSAAAGSVRISAAASLADAVKELVAVYRQAHPQVELLPNFASSGALANQLTAGAPADIYISANPQWMEYLQRQGLITAGAERILVTNSLVFIGPPRSAGAGLEDLPSLQRIAIASPASAPAGAYAEQALRAAGVYRQLAAEHKLILAKDVRQALLYADRGEVDGAFVYRTDALLATRARVLFAVPQKLYPQVTCPAALTRSGEQNAAAQAFFAYLFSPEARRIVAQYGFLPAE